MNLRKMYEKTFEVNRLVKFLNAFVIIVRKNKVNFIKSMKELLRQIILISSYMLKLKRRLKSQFERSRLRKHFIKNVSEDI